jgi:hypothetical protein
MVTGGDAGLVVQSCQSVSRQEEQLNGTFPWVSKRFQQETNAEEHALNDALTWTNLRSSFSRGEAEPSASWAFGLGCALYRSTSQRTSPSARSPQHKNFVDMAASKVGSPPQQAPPCLSHCCQRPLEHASANSAALAWVLLGCLLASCAWALASAAAQRRERRHRQLQAAAGEDWDATALRQLFRETLPSWVRPTLPPQQVTACTSWQGFSLKNVALRRGNASPAFLCCSWQTLRWCASQSG